jgi:hypothetical protein
MRLHEVNHTHCLYCTPNSLAAWICCSLLLCATPFLTLLLVIIQTNKLSSKLPNQILHRFLHDLSSTYLLNCILCMVVKWSFCVATFLYITSFNPGFCATTENFCHEIHPPIYYFSKLIVDGQIVRNHSSIFCNFSCEFDLTWQLNAASTQDGWANEQEPSWVNSQL